MPNRTPAHQQRGPSVALLASVLALVALAIAAVVAIGVLLPESQQDLARVQVFSVLALVVPSMVSQVKASERVGQATQAVDDVRDAVTEGLVSEPLRQAITETIREQLLSEEFGASVATVVRRELAAQLVATPIERRRPPSWAPPPPGRLAEGG